MRFRAINVDLYMPRRCPAKEASCLVYSVRLVLSDFLTFPHPPLALFLARLLTLKEGGPGWVPGETSIRSGSSVLLGVLEKCHPGVPAQSPG